MVDLYLYYFSFFFRLLCLLDIQLVRIVIFSLLHSIIFNPLFSLKLLICFVLLLKNKCFSIKSLNCVSKIPPFFLSMPCERMYICKLKCFNSIMRINMHCIHTYKNHYNEFIQVIKSIYSSSLYTNGSGGIERSFKKVKTRPSYFLERRIIVTIDVKVQHGCGKTKSLIIFHYFEIKKD